MKRIYHSILLISFLLLTIRCEDQLDIPPAALTEEGFFTTEDEFEKSIFGTYQKLIFFYNYRGLNFLQDVWLLPSDDLTSIGSYATETFGTINDNNGDVQNLYRFLYQLIARANIVLQKQAENPEAYLSTDLRNTHRGEALFLRGYGNYLLWNHFETAPLVTERIVDPEDARLPNSSGTQLLDQAISDFQEAATLLPSEWPDSDLGRVTSGSARGMAGKALIFRATVNGDNADYTAAIAELDQVTGYSLVTDFGDNFDENFENNSESVFEVQFGLNNVNNVWLNNDAFATVGDLGGYWGFFDNHFSMFGGGLFIATESLRNAFEDGDPRIASTFDGETVLKYVARPRANGGPDYFNNARVLRYAEVLLLKAEALNESGGSTVEALELVNQIRARARNFVAGATIPADLNINETDRTVIRQLIMDERRRELAFEEGHRWFDLRRWHKAGFIDLTRLDFSSVRTDFAFDVSTHLVLPLPASEIILNPNLTQNPGY
ncbi:MAG: RagB/SusD family nutrient uptake outer membrane protein [Bacteroidota bacterium]